MWGIKSSPVDVWLHAVSLGEVVAIIPLIEKLLLQKKIVLVTTITPSGSTKLTNYFGKKVLHQYLPWDLYFLQKKFLSCYQPKKAAIIETEIWPNLLMAASYLKVPIYLINARLSEKSTRAYSKFYSFISSCLNKFQAIYAQSALDAQRFKSLGGQNIKVLPNIKFDNHNFIRTFHKPDFCTGRILIIAGSTHNFEEEMLLRSWSIIKNRIPNAALVIVPRHSQRFASVFKLAESFYKTIKLSAPQASFDVLIIDKLGELAKWYGVCDYAFVGGSLVDHGGHNILEPAARGIPVLSGPYLKNFIKIAEELQASQALKIRNSAAAIFEEIINLHYNKKSKIAQITAAKEVIKANQGSLNKYAELLN